MHLSLKSSLGRQYLDDAMGNKLLSQFGGAAAAYSLRNLTGNGGDVVRVRRESDNAERDFTARDITSGEMVNWVNRQLVPPLDIGIETGDGRPSVPDGGTSIGTPAAAYSLRSLGTTQADDITPSGDTVTPSAGAYVVQVRRSSDDNVKSFTASEVSDGTLRNFCLNDDADLISYADAGLAGSPATDTRMYFDGVDDYVTLDSPIAFSGDFDLTWTAVITQSGAQSFFGDPTILSNDNFVVLTGLSELLVRANDYNSFITLDTALEVGSIYTFRLNRTSNTLTLYIDEVAQTDTEVNTRTLTLQNIGTSGYSGGTYLTGVIYDINFNDEASYQGYGNTNADWLDVSAGSNNGTVNGSPALFTGQGFDGHVRTWYDQSTNDNHATQTDADLQPKIVEGGSLLPDGIAFDGVNDNLLSSSHILSADDVLSLYTVAKCDDTSQRGRLVGDLFFNSGGDNGGFGLDIKAANLPTAIATYGDDGLNSHFDLADVTQGAIQLFELQLAGGSSDFLINGTVESNISTGMNSEDGGKTLIIGATSSAGDNPFIGNIKEIVIYNSDQSDNRTAIEANIGEHYSITGIPAYDDTVNGFVETWYDQSGNGNHATQLVAANQPKIVDGGDLLPDGIKFQSGVNLPLSGSGLDIFKNVDYGQIFATIKPNTIGTGINRYFEAAVGTSSVARLLFGETAITAASFRIGGRALDSDGFGDANSSTSHNNVLSLLTGFLNYTDAEGLLFLNGTQVATETLANMTAGSTSNTSSSAVAIGSTQPSLTADFDAKEIIIYGSDQSANRTGIETNINNHYDIYS